MTNAAAPARSTGSLTLQFGIVSVPVSVYTGVEEKKVVRKMRTPDGNPVKMVTADAETGEVINRSDATHVYVLEDGQEVPLTDEEIAEAMGEQNGTANLVGIFPVSELAKYSVAGVAQVRPQTAKVGKKVVHPYDKAFVLLTTALATREAFALVRYTMRGVPRLGALTADGTMRVLYWDDEVRAARPMPDASDVTAEELHLAGQLVDAMMGPTAPVLNNDAVARVEEYVAAKAKGLAPAKPEKVEPAMDLMAALRASLAATAKAS